jgi:predicted deacylase
MVRVPLHVRRGYADGPVVFVTAALHGDEINGTGAVRALIQDETLVLERGALILVPVVNVMGFERHSRYLPDRRDLNRCFPGSKTGSQASRMARVVFDEIVARADFGIDLHTAAVRRTNFPSVRADLKNPGAKWLAEVFGAEFVIDGVGPKGALRRAACRAGCPVLILEGGEVWKVEPSVVDCALRGIRNALVALDMIEEEREPPPFQVVVRKKTWIRAERGGFLKFHAAPGEFVEKGDALATNTSLLGREEEVMTAPFRAAILGMTTLPAVRPGEPVYHLGRIEKGFRRIERIRDALPEDDPHAEARDDLATSVRLEEPEDDGPPVD